MKNSYFRLPYVVGLLFFLFSTSKSTVFAQNSQDWIQKIDPTIWAKAQKGETVTYLLLLKEQAEITNSSLRYATKAEKGAYVYQTLLKKAQTTQRPIIERLVHSKVPSYRSFWLVNMIAVQSDAQMLAQLAQLPEVARVSNNPSSRLNYMQPTLAESNQLATDTTYGIKITKSHEAWAMGYSGQNITVGGADTGYDWEHPALKAKYRGWNGSTADHNYNWHDAIHTTFDTANKCKGNSKVPCDDDLHGTHTMGTMIGTSPEHLIGVAPNARWVGVRNMDEGNGTLSSYVEAFEWFIAPTDTNNQNANILKAPHVINNSWYCSTSEGCNSTNFNVLRQAVANTKAAGIVVVVSNGNFGPNCATTTGPPGFFEESFSVGATNSSDVIANFSSRGPVRIDSSNRMKPNVVAPGVAVYSAIPNGNYANLNGTSMAGPHVAGIVALILSANPNLIGRVDEVECIIERTAKPLTTTDTCGGNTNATYPNNTYGYGRIDALAAVQLALTNSSNFCQVMSLGNEDKKLQALLDFKVFPNPAQDELFLQSQTLVGESVFQLFNAKGEKMLQKILPLQKEQITRFDMSHLPQGIYFYYLMNEKGKGSGKIIKN